MRKQAMVAGALDMLDNLQSLDRRSTGRRRLRIALLGHGSRGDIQPLLAVGEELKRRGHSVAVTVNVNLVDWASRSGLDIFPIPPDLVAFMKSPRGKGILASGQLATFSRELSKHEMSVNRELVKGCIACSEGADVIVSTLLTLFRATAISERRGVPHGLLATMPVHPTTRYAQLLSPIRQFHVGALNRLSFELIVRLWWHSFAATQAETRRLLGLPPNDARPPVELLPSVGIYSEALAARPDDWDPRHVIAGFTMLSDTLRERLGEAESPDGLERWLGQGEPPVYFGFGSMPVLDPGALLQQVARVTKHRGLRGLIGAGWTDFGNGNGLPEHLFIAPAFDHDKVLPRCRAAVHHGGAGTTAATLRAGLPALVASIFADQPFWGWRVEQAGVGITLPYRRLDAATLDRALGRLLDPEMAARAHVLGARLRAEQGATVAARVIEQWSPNLAQAQPHQHRVP